MDNRRKMSEPDKWGQRYVYLNGGVPVRRAASPLARRFAQVAYAVACEVAEPEGLTGLQFAVMTYLSDEPDLGQHELAARLALDRSNMTKVLDELEQAGLVERRVSLKDRRSRLIRLTPKGIKVRERLRPKAGVAQQRLLASLKPDQRELFLDMLVTILEANESYARPGAGRRKPGYRKSQ